MICVLLISDMILCVLLNYHIICPFPVVQIRKLPKVGSGLIRRMEGQTRYGRKGLKAKDRWKWKVRFERGADVLVCERP